jgi:hypothetical protein
MKMLFTQRKALAAMPAPWRPVHRLLWALYYPFAGHNWARSLWGRYRRTWPR